jgi:hypothetical protein
MAKKMDFCEVYSYRDNLIHGEEIIINHTILFCKDRADISALTTLPIENLYTMRDESAAKEQEIFEKLCQSVTAWEEQAAQTLLINKSIEYVNVKPVEQTYNQWIQDGDSHCISNAVYKMYYRIYEHTVYDRATQEHTIKVWYLDWSVTLNVPESETYVRLAGQDRKYFTAKSKMEKYLDGRIKAYAHLFTEISPPVPQEYTHVFTVNGKLLPGYTSAKEPTPFDHVNDKLLPGYISAKELAPSNLFTASSETSANITSLSNADGGS